MSAHSYEVALFGEFFAKDLSGKPLNSTGRSYVQHLRALSYTAIMNRITLNSESAQKMHTREIVFEPYDAQHLRDMGAEPVLLRAKKELLEMNPKWYVILTLVVLALSSQPAYRILYSYLKPESVRLHPEATVRPWATCQVVGDALSFASALGYLCVEA